MKLVGGLLLGAGLVLLGIAVIQSRHDHPIPPVLTFRPNDLVVAHAGDSVNVGLHIFNPGTKPVRIIGFHIC